MSDTARNWTEDYNHENGKYLRRCVICKQEFIGHKRRVVCRLCTFPPKEPDA